MPPYLIGRDFNGSGVNWSLNFPTSSGIIAQAVCNLVQDLPHLTQLVNEPTRGNHILDLVLANLASNVRTVGSLPGSYHHAVQFDLAKWPLSHPAPKLKYSTPNVLLLMTSNKETTSMLVLYN